MSKNKTLKQIMEEFDEVAYDCYLTDDNYKKEIKVFITESIKDALEACRVEKVMIGGEFNKYTKGYWEAHNDAITQYDENVVKFLGEE